MFDVAKSLLREEASVLFVLSRTLIAFAWGHTLQHIWRHRDLPGANQALAGALAMIITQALLIFDFSIPTDTTHAFLAAGHLVIALSYTKLLNYASKEKEEQCGEGECDPVRRAYFKMMVSLSVLGVMGMAVRSWLLA